MPLLPPRAAAQEVSAELPELAPIFLKLTRQRRALDRETASCPAHDTFTVRRFRGAGLYTFDAMLRFGREDDHVDKVRTASTA